MLDAQTAKRCVRLLPPQQTLLLFLALIMTRLLLSPRTGKAQTGAPAHNTGAVKGVVSLARGLYYDGPTPGFSAKKEDNEFRVQVDVWHAKINDRDIANATTTGGAVPTFAILVDRFKAIQKDNSLDLDLDRILEACLLFENAMRRYGLHSVAKDFRGNIAKVRSALPDVSPSGTTKKNWTVGSLLAHERSVGRHHASGAVREGTAAMGLLWIRRNLAVQTRFYQHMFVDTAELDPPAAAVAAFHAVLAPHLQQPLLRRLIALSLQLVTPRDPHTLLAKLNGYEVGTISSVEEELAMEAMRSFVRVLNPVLGLWEELFEANGLHDCC